ncbi:hypothetical protein ACQ4M3_09540 [Leptolyngbya sp. AN03gr2]|uniref:hypothetical protein n=1 Tax=Leptolyngbya sp. AN03gr2 TaxID=3423364 RepID=UPI003D31E8E1
MIQCYAVHYGFDDSEFLVNAPDPETAKSWFLESVGGLIEVGSNPLRVRKVGKPQTSETFKRVCKARNVFFKPGQKIEVEGDLAYLIDGNDSGNFDVYFIEGEHAGLKLNVHPHYIDTLKTDEHQTLSERANLSLYNTLKRIPGTRTEKIKRYYGFDSGKRFALASAEVQALEEQYRSFESCESERS